jgi:formate dehydrogenase iron-sulfur subunit
MGAKGMLIDITKCVGCGQCHDACAQANGNPQTPMETYSCESWTAVLDKGNDVYVRKQCMHCQVPACASACPVAALHKTAEGPVTYRQERCMGCRYCMVACPFGVPTYEWNKTVPLVRKCILCADRLAQGKPTACSEACPTGATQFGDREALLEEARSRIRQNPDSYVQAIFGEREVGGTSNLFLAPKDFASLGFPGSLGETELPQLTFRVLSKIPTFATVAGTGLFGLFWIINRRMTLAHEDVTWNKESGSSASTSPRGSTNKMGGRS